MQVVRNRHSIYLRKQLRRAILDAIRKTLRSNQMPGEESIVGWYRSIDWYWPALRAPLALPLPTASLNNLWIPSGLAGLPLASGPLGMHSSPPLIGTYRSIL